MQFLYFTFTKKFVKMLTKVGDTTQPCNEIVRKITII